MESELSLLYRTYDALNTHDVDAVLATMTPDVDWPNGLIGGRMQGQEAVRAYCIHQWTVFSSHTEPVGYTRLSDGRLRLEIRQKVRDLQGHLLSEGTVSHTYTFRDGLIANMEIE